MAIHSVGSTTIRGRSGKRDKGLVAGTASGGSSHPSEIVPMSQLADVVSINYF